MERFHQAWSSRSLNGMVQERRHLGECWDFNFPQWMKDIQHRFSNAIFVEELSGNRFFHVHHGSLTCHLLLLLCRAAYGWLLFVMIPFSTCMCYKRQKGQVEEWRVVQGSAKLVFTTTEEDVVSWHNFQHYWNSAHYYFYYYYYFFNNFVINYLQIYQNCSFTLIL